MLLASAAAAEAKAREEQAAAAAATIAAEQAAAEATAAAAAAAAEAAAAVAAAAAKTEAAKTEAAGTTAEPACSPRTQFEQGAAELAAATVSAGKGDLVARQQQDGSDGDDDEVTYDLGESCDMSSSSMSFGDLPSACLPGLQDSADSRASPPAAPAASPASSSLPSPLGSLMEPPPSLTSASTASFGEQEDREPGRGEAAAAVGEDADSVAAVGRAVQEAAQQFREVMSLYERISVSESQQPGRHSCACPRPPPHPSAAPSRLSRAGVSTGRRVYCGSSSLFSFVPSRIAPALMRIRTSIWSSRLFRGQQRAWLAARPRACSVCGAQVLNAHAPDGQLL